METTQNNLFPKYLNQGSTGPAVAALQLFLVGVTIGKNVEINGIYDDATAERVKDLQRDLEIDDDGNFGPGTRSAVKNECGIDFNAILKNIFEGETNAVFPEGME